MQKPAFLGDNQKTAPISSQFDVTHFIEKKASGLQNVPVCQAEFPMVQLQSISRKDIKEIARVHLISFPGFFLSVLGRRFLEELYASIQDDPSGMGYIFRQEDGRLVGFVSGSTKPQRFYSHLLRRRWWRFGWAALPAFLARPSILPRLLRAFRMPRQPLPATNCATLMSIAVDPDLQRRGVGTVLIQTFMEKSRQQGMAYVNLTTDASDNQPVNAFYLRQGFHLHRTFITPEGRMMNEYLYKLADLGRKI